jgi:hypothetical protein
LLFFLYLRLPRNRVSLLEDIQSGIIVSPPKYKTWKGSIELPVSPVSIIVISDCPFSICISDTIFTSGVEFIEVLWMEYVLIYSKLSRLDTFILNQHPTVSSGLSPLLSSEIY